MVSSVKRLDDEGVAASFDDFTANSETRRSSQHNVNERDAPKDTHVWDLPPTGTSTGFVSMSAPLQLEIQAKPIKSANTCTDDMEGNIALLANSSSKGVTTM